MDRKIPLKEINKFLDTTHRYNLEILRARLILGKWHWMFPTNWENNSTNRELLSHAINSRLLPAPRMFRRFR